jgi:hypothetical protein
MLEPSNVNNPLKFAYVMVCDRPEQLTRSSRTCLSFSFRDHGLNGAVNV